MEQREKGTLQAEELLPLSSENQPQYCVAATEFNVTLHGEDYHIKVNGTGHKAQQKRAFYINVDGVPEEVIVETLDEIISLNDTNSNIVRSATGSSRPMGDKPGDVTTSMPGTVVDILVAEGDSVNAGDPVLVVEAMKMETEIQAPISGKVSAIHVAKGDTVNPDEALIQIE